MGWHDVKVLGARRAKAIRARKASAARPRKAAPSNRGYGRPGVAKYDPNKHPRGPGGKFVTTGGRAKPARKHSTAVAAPAPSIPVAPSHVPLPRVSSDPILPGRPIAERIAAYKDGHERVARLAEMGRRIDPLERDVAARAARVDAAIAKHARARSDKGRARARQEMEAEQAGYREAHARYEKALAETRQQAQEILATGGKFHVGVDGPKLDDRMYSAVAEGTRWMQRNVAPAGGRGAAPDDSWSVPVAHVGAREELRSYATAEGVKMAAADPSTYVHEAAHYFDSHDAGMLDSSRKFLEHRAGDEKPTPLRRVLKGEYDPSETGRKDRFDEALGDRGWYAGKQYPDLYTEIHSMGFEEMHRNPARFAAKDPEYATYILGIMHGPLR